jgi:hypothetical protein
MLWPDLQKKYPTPRSGWREALRPGDWRIAYRQKIEDEFWSNYQLLSPLKEAA